jgi:hypothetical protein
MMVIWYRYDGDMVQIIKYVNIHSCCTVVPWHILEPVQLLVAINMSRMLRHRTRKAIKPTDAFQLFNFMLAISPF